MQSIQKDFHYWAFQNYGWIGKQKYIRIIWITNFEIILFLLSSYLPRRPCWIHSPLMACTTRKETNHISCILFFIHGFSPCSQKSIISTYQKKSSLFQSSKAIFILYQRFDLPISLLHSWQFDYQWVYYTVFVYRRISFQKLNVEKH